MKPRFNYFKAPDQENAQEQHILLYCEWGDPKNTNVLMCVHGLSRNSRDFDYLAAALSEKYRIICLDVAGRGKSEWLRDRTMYNYETYVTDVIKLLNHLNIKQLDWIGTSMGGVIGMIIASRYQHIIKRLILNDIGPIIPGKAIERIINYSGLAHEFENKSDAERTLRNKMASFGITKEEHWKHLLKHSIIKKLNGKYAFSYDPEIIPKPPLGNIIKILIKKLRRQDTKSHIADVNLLDIWHKISCPILALRGTESDVLTADIANQMASSKENITLIDLENIGHAPMLMEDKQINIVTNWLQK